MYYGNGQIDRTCRGNYHLTFIKYLSRITQVRLHHRASIETTFAPPIGYCGMKAETSKTTTDGRKLRAENRRIKIYETLLSFYREGIYCPTIAEIEKRSGVSRRTLHHLFKNAEGLAAALAEHLNPTYATLYRFEATEGTLEQRIETLVKHRAKLYEKITPTRMASIYYMSQIPSIAKSQAAAHQALRDHVRHQFKAELANRPEELLEILDLLTSWDTWNRLRTIQNLSVKASISFLCNLVASQFNH